MFMRALFAFLALPGTVAFLVPALMAWRAGSLERPGGTVLLALGCIGLLWCVRDFYVAGKGTLAPWSPPKRLVVVGLYRYSRNPMYVAVTLILIGWAISFAERALYIYAIAVTIAFHLRVVYGEEPWLARTHGEQWEAYAREVPRWLWAPKHGH